MEITQTNIENRKEYDSLKCIHGLKNELRKNRNGTKQPNIDMDDTISCVIQLAVYLRPLITRLALLLCNGPRH
ncbi:hypothetical protein V1477_021183 [Vespula maculifrons]|uniref:Uncharacterized protein n=1 Tax=Vespula maculifrons TaxID=7453 RepID=A0ABD2AGE0_VESMC